MTAERLINIYLLTTKDHATVIHFKKKKDIKNLL